MLYYVVFFSLDGINEEEKDVLVNNLYQISFKSATDKAIQFAYALNLEMNYYHNIKDYNKAVDVFNEKYLHNFENYLKYLNSSHRLIIYHHISKLFLYEKKLEFALFLNNLALENVSKNRIEMYNYTKINELLIHYSLGNLVYVKHKLNILVNFLKRKNKFLENEKNLIEFIKNLINAESEVEKQAIINVYLPKFKVDTFFNDYIDIPAWVKTIQ